MSHLIVVAYRWKCSTFDGCGEKYVNKEEFQQHSNNNELSIGENQHQLTKNDYSTFPGRRLLATWTTMCSRVDVIVVAASLSFFPRLCVMAATRQGSNSKSKKACFSKGLWAYL